MEDKNKPTVSSEEYFGNTIQRNISSLQFGVQMYQGNRIRMDTSKAFGDFLSVILSFHYLLLKNCELFFRYSWISHSAMFRNDILR